MLCDYHVHSCFSDDSDYPLEHIVLDALRMNLEEICFTEHVDYGVKPEWNQPDFGRFENGRPVTNCAYIPYLNEVGRVRNLYGHQIGIKAGLELGVQRHTVHQNHALVKCLAHKLDFVICSIHQVENLEFFNGDFQAVHGENTAIQVYFEELLAVVETFRDYCVLGHMDLICRHVKRDSWFEDSKDVIAAILMQVIADGKGIEVNTSGIRYGLNRFMPSHEILTLYRDLGGRIVTIGSDSHKPQHLGSYLLAAQRELQVAGFDGFYTYEHMEPTFHAFGDARATETIIRNKTLSAVGSLCA